jgi:hypothetical protein
MRGAWPAILVVLALLACGTTRISTPAVAVTRPSTSSTTNPKAVDPGSCGIASRLLSADVSATWGSTQPSVWLTEREGGLDVWYLASSRGAYQSTRLERDGSLKGTTEVLPFAGLGEASDPVIASDGGLVAIVDTVYRAHQHAEIMLTLGSPRRWSKPFAVLPGAELDDDPAMAFGNGLLAIVWNRGTYPMAPDLAVAVVTRDGRVLGGGVVEHDAQAEGAGHRARADGGGCYSTRRRARSREVAVGSSRSPSICKATSCRATSSRRAHRCGPLPRGMGTKWASPFATRRKTKRRGECVAS